MTHERPAELKLQRVFDGHEGMLTTVASENDHQLTGHDDGQRDRSGPFLGVRGERHVVSLIEEVDGIGRNVGVVATFFEKPLRWPSGGLT